MSPLPLPIRLAAGLAAVALERARKLPQDVTEWPMTAVSQALQTWMRVQQHITELAIKGDEALAALREPEEDPPWAVFDEDLPRSSYRRRPEAPGSEPPDAEPSDAETPDAEPPDAETLDAETPAEPEPQVPAGAEVLAEPGVPVGLEVSAETAD